jgi:hypothetical protein
MPQHAGSGFLVILAIVILSGPALAQSAAAERSQRKDVRRSWADEVRSAIGSGKAARSARPAERGRGSTPRPAARTCSRRRGPSGAKA